MTIPSFLSDAKSYIRGLFLSFIEFMLWLMRLAVTGLMVGVAFVVAMATALTGLLLAVAAVLIHACGRGRNYTKASTKPSSNNAQSATLDAKQTSSGWVVEN